MSRFICLVRCAVPLVAWSVALIPTCCAAAEGPVALRVESFTVPPSTGPLAVVDLENRQDTPYQGTVAMKGPEGWRITPARQEVSLGSGETKRVAFSVEKGLNLEANSYPFEVSAVGAGNTVVRRQNVVCASAPYFKPTIDGLPDEWKDAIPITFETGGRKTVVSTYWNRRQLSLLVEVEEDKLVEYQDRPSPGGFDALQVSISPEDARTGSSPSDMAERYEFLFVSAGGGAKCFRLAVPETKLAEAAKDRPLGPLLDEDAKVAVVHKEGRTRYECGIPMRRLRDRIRPSEGREFFLSVLIHDCDGTGIRDWGEAAGLWPWQRSPWAWSRFQGAKWGPEPPFDNKLRWGLCTSKY